MDINFSDLSDEKIAQTVQSGGKDAGTYFGVLVERYQAKLLRYGKRFLSSPENIEDMVQEVFVKTYQNIQSFDTSQKFSSWIYRVAHNTFVNELRRESRMPVYFFDFDTLVSHTFVEDPIVREKEQEEMKEIVDKGLELLPPLFREIIVLYYMEELSYQEISDILHIPIGTVGVRLKRARETLRKEYEKNNISLEL